VLHDLGVIDERSLVHVLLVFVPPLIWVVAIVAKRVPNAFLTGGVIGSLYGVALAVIHQFAWASVWGDNPFRLGANCSIPQGPRRSSSRLGVWKQPVHRHRRRSGDRGDGLADKPRHLPTSNGGEPRHRVTLTQNVNAYAAAATRLP
jgi:hypothetical protein